LDPIPTFRSHPYCPSPIPAFGSHPHGAFHFRTPRQKREGWNCESAQPTSHACRQSRLQNRAIHETGGVRKRESALHTTGVPCYQKHPPRRTLH